MRVAVYSIALNEEKHVERWEACSRDADYRLILDTGSTDKTVRLARSLGITVHEQAFDPFSFCDARNAALDLIPEWVDMCVTLDLDEVLHEGWRDALEALPADATRPRYKYVWSRNADGSEGMVYSGHSAHHRRDYEWQYPIHEMITPTGVEVSAACGMVIEHKPDGLKPRTQYLPMLARHAAEQPESDRAAFYYARELLFRDQPADAAGEFKRHLGLAASVWRPERAASMRYLAKCEPGKAETWLLRACAEAPDRREPWVDLAQHYYTIEDWGGVYYAAARALSITERPVEYFCEAYAWNETPHDLAALGAYNLGLYAAALEHGRQAVKLNPTSERLATNLDWYERAV
jgi:tetratricopeptide (TPR) repeat protein